ncbi:CBS domain-containing protein, partial [Candidatus Woesearchaeota archaeon]|nr:CBS domain-containing protein [Candidatus Woesearchaeota archaeon]
MVACDHKEKRVEKHLITKIPVVKETATVRDVLSILENKSNKYDSVDYIYVIDEKENLVGMFYIQELFNNARNTPIKKFIHKNPVTISLKTELE